MVEVRGLKKYFPIRKGVLQRPGGWVKAVDNISFRIDRGETFGLAGESGCGKTTTARLILNLISSDQGEVFFEGLDVLKADKRSMLGIRREMQMVFQDPFSSLNPRMKAGDIVSEGLLLRGRYTPGEIETRLDETFEMVGLPRAYKERYPHQFSGGERQRIGIARAVILRPKFIVLDEPVSSLDVSIQARVLGLLKKLKEELNLTYLFITHDLAVVANMCDRVAIMNEGRIVESGPTRAVFSEPGEEYTLRLLRSIPLPEPGRR